MKSLVLLRNEGGVLPLATDRRIAVIGPAADDERLLQGDYSYPAHTEIVQPRDRDGRLIESDGDFAPGPYYPESVTPLAGIRAVARDVTYCKGAGVRGTKTDGFAEAVADARGRRRRDLLRRRTVGSDARLHERRVPRRQ